MNIVEIKAKKIFAGDEGYALVGEATITDSDGNEVFVSGQIFNGSDLTVSKQSMYRALAEDGADPAEDFLEEYSSFDDAEKSEYADAFRAVRNAVAILG